jgi:segregation and condensation protein B
VKPKRKKKKRSRRVRAEAVQVDEPSTGGATVATTDDEPDAAPPDQPDDEPDAEGAEEAADGSIGGAEEAADAPAEPGKGARGTRKRAPAQGRDAAAGRRGRKDTGTVRAGGERAADETRDDRGPGRRRGKKAVAPDEVTEASEVLEAPEVRDEPAPAEESEAEERGSGRRRGKKGKAKVEADEVPEVSEVSEVSDEPAPAEESEVEERGPGRRRGKKGKGTVAAAKAVAEPGPDEAREVEEPRPGRRRRGKKATESVEAAETAETSELAEDESSDVEGEGLESSPEGEDEAWDGEAAESSPEGEGEDEDAAEDEAWDSEAEESADQGEDEAADGEDVADEAWDGEAEESADQGDDDVGDGAEALAGEGEGSEDLAGEAGAGEAGDAQDRGDAAGDDDDEDARSMARRKSILESLLYASDKPLSLKRMAELMHERQLAVVHEVLETLIADYRGRGIELFEVAGGWQFRTAAENSSWVQQLVSGKPVRLSRAQLETMAIVAYRQPITRPEIDEIRGVDSGGTLKVLLDRNLIRVLGKKEEAGRPLLYGTTKEFLTFFNLNDLRELPTLREYHELTEDSRRVVEQRLGVSLDDLPGKGQIAVEGDSEDFAADVEADLAGRGPVGQADEDLETEPGEGEDWPTQRVAPAPGEAVPDWTDEDGASDESETGEGEDWPEASASADSEADEGEVFVSDEDFMSYAGEGVESEESEGEGVESEESEAEGVESEESEADDVESEESEADAGAGFVPDEDLLSDEDEGVAREAGEDVAFEESEAGEGFVPDEDLLSDENEGFVPDAGEELVPDEDLLSDEHEGFVPDAGEELVPDEDLLSDEDNGLPDAGEDLGSDEKEGSGPDAGEDLTPDEGLAPVEATEIDVDADEREAAGFSDSEPTRVDDEAAFASGEDEGDSAAFAATLRDVLAAVEQELEQSGGQDDDEIEEIAARVASEMPLAPDEDPLRTWPDVAEADAAASSPVAAEDDSATHEEG